MAYLHVGTCGSSIQVRYLYAEVLLHHFTGRHPDIGLNCKSFKNCLRDQRGVFAWKTHKFCSIHNTVFTFLLYSYTHLQHLCIASKTRVFLLFHEYVNKCLKADVVFFPDRLSETCKCTCCRM